MPNVLKKVMWTGGWDSSFRVVQLSRISGISIQGVYISGDFRVSEEKEIDAINTITEMLRKRSETQAEIMPLMIVDKKDIPQNQYITDAYNRLRTEIKIGTQYDWLARFAYVNPGVELGAELPDGEFSGIRETIERFGGLKKVSDTYKLDINKASDDCKAVFENFEFPLAFTKESDMLAMIKKWGYEDIMSHIWFCHTPYKGKACGICRPCEQKMEEKMEFLLPDDAQRRYKKMKVLKGMFGERGRNLLYKIYR